MKHIFPTLLLLCLVFPAAAQTAFTYQNQTLQPGKNIFLVGKKNGADEAGNNPYIFSSVKDALLAAERLQKEVRQEQERGMAVNPYSESNPLSIYIEPSVYWLDDPDDPAIRKPLPGEGIPYGMKLELSHLRLIGMGNTPEETILASNRGQTQGAMGNFTMLHFTGNDIRAENLTFGNYCNLDLVYPRNPKLNRKKRAEAIVQAQLIIVNGDKVVARRCHFISRLNSCPFAGSRRALFEDCYFECTDDALCGTGVYLHCKFTLFSSKPFYSTQGNGAVMLDCDLHALTESHQYLTKVGSPIALVDCRWTSEHPNLYIGWTPVPGDDLRCYQHNVILNGAPYIINQEKPECTIEMTGKPLLRAYMLTDHDGTPIHLNGAPIYNVYNLLRGNDDWDPLQQKALIADISRQQGNFLQPIQLFLSRRSISMESGKDTLTLSANIPHVRWLLSSADSDCIDIQDKGNGECLLIGKNTDETPRTVMLQASTPEGLEAACPVLVKPAELPPPAFVEKPVIREVRIKKSVDNKGALPLEGDASLCVNYQLDLGSRADQSLITWYRCTDAKGRNAIPVAVSRMDTPLRTYPLTAADNCYYIMVSVAPKHLRSQPGEAMTAITKKRIRKIDPETTRTLHTDFVNFPTERQPELLPGFWTLDGYKPADTQAYDWEADNSGNTWAYGKGVDGAAHSYGLLQTVKGARLRYTPIEGTYGDMRLVLKVAPCKPAGQGFGSATGQYMDILIKLDTKTMTGYALRIVRTTQNDKAVDFVLMKYSNGIATPISVPVSTICYRTGCVITLQAEGHRLTAHAENTNPLPALHKAGLTTTVDLEAEIETNDWGGIGVLHTGSTGASATLLQGLEVEWR